METGSESLDRISVFTMSHVLREHDSRRACGERIPIT